MIRLRILRRDDYSGLSWWILSSIPERRKQGDLTTEEKKKKNVMTEARDWSDLRKKS